MGSCTSIFTLADSGRPAAIRDSLPLARSIIETLINVSYILAAGEEAAALMERHAMQRTYRDLYRINEIAGFRVGYAASSRPDLATHPELKEALDEFTRKNGKEITSWTSLSLEERLDVIGKRFGLGTDLRLRLAFFKIYRHSSEIIHGTYYGNLYFLCGPPAARDRPNDDLAVTTLEHLVGLEHALIGAIEATMTAASEVLSSPAYAAAARGVVNEMLKIPGMIPIINDELGS
jgi:hypothetical protein